ncbi:MAG: c-type cytochrome [Clostridia bacterium]|nr:c-type cytochrome [Clostridia bacterium]
MKFTYKRLMAMIGIVALLITMITLLTVSAVTGSSVEGHTVLISGSGMDRIALINDEGNTVWTLPRTSLGWVEVNDADMLPNGDIVFAARHEAYSAVYAVRPAYPQTTGYELLWTYRVPSGAENHTSQALPDGGVLVGEAYDTYVRIVELDEQGNLRKTLGGQNAPLTDWPTISGRHNQIRQIHKTADGTYLLAAMGANKTLAYSATGEKLAEYPAGGFTAVLDANGNVLVAGGDRHTLSCFSREDAGLLWSIEQNTLEGVSLGFVAALDVLDNGNILLANWGGHGGASGDAVMEIVPPADGESAYIAWSLNCGSATSNVQSLDGIDEQVWQGRPTPSPFVPAQASEQHRSPADLVGSLSTDRLYVADKTNCTVEVISHLSGILINEIAVSQEPNALLLSRDGCYLYVATGGYDGKIEVFDTNALCQIGEVAVGHTPSALVQSEDGSMLYVANRFDGTVQSIPLTNGLIPLGTVPQAELYVTREPMSMAITAGKLYVGGHLPTGDMNDGTVSAEIVVVSTADMTVQKTVTMVSGSTNLKDIALSPDGQYVYASHALGRWNVATTHADRGWIYTNAITEIRTADDTVTATMLVDDLDLGAANPWGIDVSTDKIVLSISGTHELMVLDRARLREKIDGVYAGTLQQPGYLTNAADISVDLTFTTELKQRIQLGEDGPRGIELIGGIVYTANYYSGSVSRYDCNTGALKTIALQTSRQEDAERGGERLWNDATIGFGQWQSCASCHPDGRNDALNWDNMNDGIGTPKQVRSMVGAWLRGRVMATGIRANVPVANRAGVRYILFNAGMPESEIEKIDAYTAAIRAEVSPYLENGKLSASALRGKALFEGKANCASCHGGAQYGADKLIYENYVQSETETRGLLVPPLVEVWRTAPYLHDGSAATIQDVLTTRNLTGTHGNVQDLSVDEMDDLCNYVLSLGTDYEEGGEEIPEEPEIPSTSLSVGNENWPTVSSGTLQKGFTGGWRFGSIVDGKFFSPTTSDDSNQNFYSSSYNSMGHSTTEGNSQAGFLYLANGSIQHGGNLAGTPGFGWLASESGKVAMEISFNYNQNANLVLQVYSGGRVVYEAPLNKASSQKAQTHYVDFSVVKGTYVAVIFRSPEPSGYLQTVNTPSISLVYTKVVDLPESTTLAFGNENWPTVLEDGTLQKGFTGGWRFGAFLDGSFVSPTTKDTDNLNFYHSGLASMGYSTTEANSKEGFLYLKAGSLQFCPSAYGTPGFGWMATENGEIALDIVVNDYWGDCGVEMRVYSGSTLVQTEAIDATDSQAQSFHIECAVTKGTYVAIIFANTELPTAWARPISIDSIGLSYTDFEEDVAGEHTISFVSGGQVVSAHTFMPYVPVSLELPTLADGLVWTTGDGLYKASAFHGELLATDVVFYATAFQTAADEIVYTGNTEHAVSVNASALIGSVFGLEFIPSTADGWYAPLLYLNGQYTSDWYYGCAARCVGDDISYAVKAAVEGFPVYVDVVSGTTSIAACMKATANAYPACVDVVNASLNYAAEAQKYFQYKTDALVYTGEALSTDITFTNSIALTSPEGMPVVLTGAALLLEDDVRFKLTLDMEPFNESYRLKITNKTSGAVSYAKIVAREGGTAEDGRYKALSVIGVAPLCWNDAYDFCIVDANDNPASATLTYSVGTYVERMEESVGGVAEAMRVLYAAALAYNTQAS